jgi:outer membrane protein
LQEQQKDYATFVDTLSQTLQAALDTYGQYFISLKKQDILQKSVEANQYLLDQNRKKLILQTVPETEVLAAQVALQNAKADLASAQNNTQKLRLDLQLLIAQTQLPLIPVTQNVFLVTYNADNLPTTNFLAQNPKLKIAQIDLAKSQLSLTYYQNQALPQFDLIASLGSAKTDTNFGNTWSFSSPTYTLGFSLGLPLGNNQANAKLAKQQLALKQAQLNLANVQQDLANQSAKAQLDVSFQQANIQNYQLVVQSAEQKLKLNKQQFDLGLITTDKVITAETDLATAQQNLDQAYVNYVIAIFVLEGLKGNPLSWDY